MNPRLSGYALVLGVFLLAFSGAFRETAYAQSTPHPFTALPNWQYGFFAAGGYAQDYKISYQFTLSTGQLGNL